MRILVFGATGLIGRAVTQALVAAGHAVTALARSPARAHDVRAMGATPLAGDMTRPETWQAAAAASDAVVQLAAAFGGDLAAADAAWTDGMIEAARGRHTRPRVIYTGGCWLYPARTSPAISEADSFAPLAPFAHMVRHRDRLRGAGMEVLTLHPGLVWSARAGCTADIRDAVARHGRVEVVGAADTLWPLVHVRDLAALYLRALHPDAPCTDVLAVTDPGVAVADIVAAAERSSGRTAVIDVVGVEEAVRRHGSWVAGKARSQRIEACRARRLLGWRPERPFAAG